MRVKKENEKKSLFMQHVSKSQQDCTNTPDDTVSREGNSQRIGLGEPRSFLNL